MRLSPLLFPLSSSKSSDDESEASSEERLKPGFTKEQLEARLAVIRKRRALYRPTFDEEEYKARVAAFEEMKRTQPSVVITIKDGVIIKSETRN